MMPYFTHWTFKKLKKVAAKQKQHKKQRQRKINSSKQGSFMLLIWPEVSCCFPNTTS